MTNFDVYSISKSNKVEFVGVFEGSMPFNAIEKAEKQVKDKNCTMRAFVTGSERAEKFAAESK